MVGSGDCSAGSGDVEGLIWVRLGGMLLFSVLFSAVFSVTF